MSKEERRKAYHRINATMDQIKAGLAEEAKALGDAHVSTFLKRLVEMGNMDDDTRSTAIRRATMPFLDDMVFFAMAGVSLMQQADVDRKESFNELEGR